MDQSAKEKISGYTMLLSVLPKYSRTHYPYDRLNVANAQFTQNKIEIIANKIDERAKFFRVDDKKDKKEKRGGDESPGIVIYG